MIDDVKYVRTDKINTLAPLKDGLEYAMVRTYAAGVFAGYIEKMDEATGVVKLRHARRIHYWDGAASLSELSTRGTSKPKSCRFPCEVDSVRLFEVVEIIPITKEAQENIASVPVWTK